MSKVVNLNRFRKQKARAAAAETASENRVRFGRTKAQKLLDAENEAEARKRMDQLRRDPAPDAAPEAGDAATPKD